MTKRQQPKTSEPPPDGSDPMGRTKEIMRRLAEMPHKPHEPIGKRTPKRQRKSKEKEGEP
jgi:hypothetical protein